MISTSAHKSLYTIKLWTHRARSLAISPCIFVSDNLALNPIQVFRYNIRSARPCNNDARHASSHPAKARRSAVPPLEPDLHSLQLAPSSSINGILLFYHPHGRPVKLFLEWFTSKWLSGALYRIAGLRVQSGGRACMRKSESKIKHGAPLT